MGSKELKITSVGDFEITVTENPAMSHVTLMKVTDIFTGYKKTQLGLSKKDVTQLIRNLMEVSGVSQEDLAEKEYLWRVPPELSGEGDIPWLVQNKVTGEYYISRSDELSSEYYKELFTEAEVESIKKDHPTFHVLVKDIYIYI